jgi:uncharacterized protein
MNTDLNPIEKYSLPAFLVLTILLSVVVYLLPTPREVVPMLVVLVPAILAVILASMSGGRGAVSALFRSLFQVRIHLKWYLITIGLALLVRLSISVLALLLGWIPTIQVRSGTLAGFVGMGVGLFISAALEELGWRGYALPRMLKRMPALHAALWIGVLWGSLHLILLLPGMMYAGEHPLAMLLMMVGLSVVTAWLFVQTGGSLFITSLFHAAQSTFVLFHEGISLTQISWLSAVVYAVLVLALAALFGAHLRRPSGTPAVIKAGSEL